MDQTTPKHPPGAVLVVYLWESIANTPTYGLGTLRVPGRNLWKQIQKQIRKMSIDVYRNVLIYAK